MKQLSLWFVLFSCAVLAVLLPESCTKENGVLDQKGLSKTSALSTEKTSTTTPAADPAIAYVNNYNLMVMNADGSNQTIIVPGDNVSNIQRPSWSRDAHSIAFIRTISGVRSMWIADVSVQMGKPPVALNLHPVQINLTGYPAWAKWSPVADSIVFINLAPHVNDPNIYIVASTGGNPRVVYTAVTTGPPSPTSAGCEYPTWSSDGSKLAFFEISDGGVTASHYLNVFDLITGAVTTVVRFGSNAGERTLAWSRNGDRIAYAYGTNSLPETIYTVTPTLNATPVSLFAGYSPSWAPLDSKLVYNSPVIRSDKAGIYSYTFSGNTRQRLSDGTFPDWKR